MIGERRQVAGQFAARAVAVRVQLGLEVQLLALAQALIDPGLDPVGIDCLERGANVSRP